MYSLKFWGKVFKKARLFRGKFCEFVFSQIQTDRIKGLFKIFLSLEDFGTGI